MPPRSNNSWPNWDIDFSYGFEIEQYHQPQNIRQYTEKYSGVMKEYGGHDDQGKWEIGSFNPKSFKSTIKQLNDLYYSDITFKHNLNLAAVFGKTSITELTNKMKIPVSSNMPKYYIPFPWWNNCPSNSGSGSHIHIGINTLNFIKGELKPIDVEHRVLYRKKYLKDYLTVWNLFTTFYWATLNFYFVSWPPRNNLSKFSQWAKYPTEFIGRDLASWDDFFFCQREQGHPYCHPSPRNWCPPTVKVNNEIKKVLNNNYQTIPSTVELRANENIYTLAGELTKRFLNFAAYVIKEMRIQEDYYKPSGNILDVNYRLFNQMHSYNDDFYGLLSSSGPIDLGREFRYDKFRIYRKYPSMLHLAVHLVRSLGMFGQDYGRDLCWLYSHLPQWKNFTDDNYNPDNASQKERAYRTQMIMWNFEDIVKNKEIDLDGYLVGIDQTINNITITKPVHYKSESTVKQLLKESMQFNRGV